MQVDPEINKILTNIEKGYHSIEEASIRFLESLPGYNYRFHRPNTIKSYERCLLRDPNNFNDYMKKEGINYIELVPKDHLEFYKNFILNKVEPRTAAKFVTAVRQLFKFIKKIGWIENNIAADFELPKPNQKKEIEVIKPEVCELLLNGNWGYNDYTRRRNHLILCFFLRRGMHPKEIPDIMLEHIEQYRDLAVISVCGKRNRWREVMLDPYTYTSLQEYSIERGKYVAWRDTRDEHLILSSTPRFDKSYQMSTPGVSAIIKRMTKELQKNGCLHSLKHVTPNIMRHTAETADWERVEHLPVKNPEMSVSGQYGNSPAVALKHYVRRSRRNSYILLKGGAIIDDAKNGDSKAPEKMQDLESDFPEISKFPNWDMGL